MRRAQRFALLSHGKRVVIDSQGPLLCEMCTLPSGQSVSCTVHSLHIRLIGCLSLCWPCDHFVQSVTLLLARDNWDKLSVTNGSLDSTGIFLLRWLL